MIGDDPLVPRLFTPISKDEYRMAKAILIKEDGEITTERIRAFSLVFRYLRALAELETKRQLLFEKDPDAIKKWWPPEK